MKIRYCILLSFLLLSCCVLKAQDFEILSVESLTADMSAREEIKTDHNDRQCALLRVATQNIAPNQREGFSFKTDLGSEVVERASRNGEIWLWVSPGLKYLRIMHGEWGQYELRLQDHVPRVEALHTYKITINGKLPLSTQEQASDSLKLQYLGDSLKQQHLVFRIMPKDAVLEVNGQVWPVSSDGIARKLVPFGNYRYRIRATNYHAEEGEVVVNNLQDRVVVNANLMAVSGLFSVSATQQVYFSKGNLQYRASTNTWRFAEHQWDYVGEDNSNISQTYDGWIDLFGWGTSGYNHGAVCYQPWSTSLNHSDYYAYGQYIYNLYDLTGEADWGYNPISNGGETENTWRTLTLEEWQYVFNKRNTPSGILYAMAKVNNINGVILLPDDWQSSYYSLSLTNPYRARFSSASFSSNIITSTQWATLEQHGAVFLPAAGRRIGTSVSDAGSTGGYWSSSYSNSYYACHVGFYDSGLGARGSRNRRLGRSVRLVHSFQ